MELELELELGTVKRVIEISKSFFLIGEGERGRERKRGAGFDTY